MPNIRFKHSNSVLIGVILLVVWCAFVVGRSSNNESSGTVFLNMKMAITQPIKLIGAKLDKHHQQKFIEAYNHALRQTIQRYATQHKVNIVTATTLYDYSGIDITQAIIKANLKAVEQGGQS